MDHNIERQRNPMRTLDRLTDRAEHILKDQMFVLVQKDLKNRNLSKNLQKQDKKQENRTTPRKTGKTGKQSP